MNITDIQTLHSLVWSYRNRLSSLWPTPSCADSLAFAFTEIGEAVDAQLRQNPVYNRNHDKNVDVDSELADCLIMLLTAMGDQFSWRTSSWDWYHKSCMLSLETIAFQVVGALIAKNGYVGDAVESIILVWEWQSDIYTTVKDRLDRIEKRVTCAS